MIDTVLDIIEKYELGDAVTWILDHNPSQALPYHNFSHSLDVLYYSVVAYCYDERADNCARFGSVELPKEMLYAALFHDFGHSGGFFTDDSANIEVAVDGFDRYVAFSSTKDYDVIKLMDEIKVLIYSTRYPHAKDDTEVLMQCLQDADLFQYCSTLMSSLIGIKQELFRHLDWESFIWSTIK